VCARRQLTASNPSSLRVGVLAVWVVVWAHPVGPQRLGSSGVALALFDDAVAAGRQPGSCSCSWPPSSRLQGDQTCNTRGRHAHQGHSGQSPSPGLTPSSRVSGRRGRRVCSCGGQVHLSFAEPCAHHHHNSNTGQLHSTAREHFTTPIVHPLHHASSQQPAAMSAAAAPPPLP
jgi:hypothetical protein